MDKIKGMVKEGNTCLFAIFILFNFLLFLTSIGTLGVAIYLFALTKSANAFNIGFLVIAVVLFAFTFCAFRLRRSIHLLGFYLVIIFVIFLVNLIITICVFANKDKMIEWAKQNISDSDKTMDEIQTELNAHVK